MKADIMLAATFLALVLLQPIYAAECIPQDQLTEEDRYVGRLKNKCVLYIQKKNGFNVATLSDGTISLYNAGENTAIAVAGRRTKETLEQTNDSGNEIGTNYDNSGSKRRRLELMNKFTQILYSLPVELLTDENLAEMDTLAYETLRIPPESNGWASHPYTLGMMGNRYKNAFKSSSWFSDPNYRIEFLDGYISGRGRSEDVPDLNEKVKAIQELKEDLLATNGRHLITSKTIRVIRRFDPQSFHKLTDAGKLIIISDSH
jgi:hypothetical protein